MTPTQPTPPTPPPGPPTGPPSGPPPASPGAPPKKRGPSVPLVAFIVVVVLLVVAAALAIFAFVGKSSESDDKDKAQKELASTKREFARTRERLGETQQTAEDRGRVLSTAAQAADALKACTDSSRSFIQQFINSIGQIVSGGGVPPELQTAANDTDSKCATSDDSYQNLIRAIRAL
jgi:type II secretory pathway pseudopilin PulG